MATRVSEPAKTELDQLCINAIRMLAVDAVELASSGHAGAPMGLAPAAYALWDRVLQHDPADPAWPDRDRFVLSAGHASLLLYSLLHLTGYDLPLDELKRFRQWGSKPPDIPNTASRPEWKSRPAHSARAWETPSAWPSQRGFSPTGITGPDTR